MMKYKFIWVSIGLCVICGFLFFKYNSYKVLKTDIGIFWEKNIDFIYFFREYLPQFGRFPNNINDVYAFKKHDNVFISTFQKINPIYIELMDEDSVVIYTKGFDNDDDLGKILYGENYGIDKISFWESLFIDGDLLLLKYPKKINSSVGKRGMFCNASNTQLLPDSLEKNINNVFTSYIEKNYNKKLDLPNSFENRATTVCTETLLLKGIYHKGRYVLSWEEVAITTSEINLIELEGSLPVKELRRLGIEFFYFPIELITGLSYRDGFCCNDKED